MGSSPADNARLTSARPLLAGAVAGALLLGLYLATLAPGVTFWDAGELIAAAHTLGIPHPPGTPLFVFAAHAWAALWRVLPTAVATNLFSAACTATAGALTASLVARWTGRTSAGVAAALAAGSMSTVWLNATETEVYAASLLLAWLMLWSADRASLATDPRWPTLTSYLFALAPALHLSALVAAPAAVARAALAERDGRRWHLGAGLAAVALVAAGVGSAASPPALVGAALLITLLLRARDGTDRRTVLMLAAVTALALSALLMLLVRARHDPPINQGNPSTLDALVAVVGRRQYAVASLYPRQAPLWLQLGNVLEYADWQVALGVAPGVAPQWLRTSITLLFALLAAYGGRVHRLANRASWRALAVLALCATVGVVAYLNLKAGPSFGHGVIPDDAPREARERDYFFALAFWCWGTWAGIGAVALAGRFGRRLAWAGVAAAATPIALNWRAVDRRREPDASLPRTVARALLTSAPRRAVLFVAGDNDTYPLWYAQRVERLRPDVTVVTIPLLSASWYRAELVRRQGLNATDRRASRGETEALRAVARAAETLGRPVAVAVSVPAVERLAVGEGWRMQGLAYVLDSAGAAFPLPGTPVESLVTREVAALVAPQLLGAEPAGASAADVTDPTGLWMRAMLGCASLALRAGADSAAAALLDSRCKRR